MAYYLSDMRQAALQALRRRSGPVTNAIDRLLKALNSPRHAGKRNASTRPPRRRRGQVAFDASGRIRPRADPSHPRGKTRRPFGQTSDRHRAVGGASVRRAALTTERPRQRREEGTTRSRGRRTRQTDFAEAFSGPREGAAERGPVGGVALRALAAGKAGRTQTRTRGTFARRQESRPHPAAPRRSLIANVR